MVSSTGYTSIPDRDVVIPGDLAHSWAGLPVMMPRNTRSGSNTGVEAHSLLPLNEANVGEQLSTVPCSVNVVKLRQSSKKLVLKNGSGYYNLTREESSSYRIEGIKVLRTRNRSMPTATQKRGRKMNRPDPRDQGFHHYSQSRESGFLNTSPGDYHKQGRYDSRYSGPYRSRGRDNRFEQRRHWSPRSNYGNRGGRGSYGRDNNNSRDQYERRASSYPIDSSRGRRMVSPESRYDRSPEGRYDRSPEGDYDSGFQERAGRYPDQRSDKKSRQGASGTPETPKTLASTYKKAGESRVPSNHTITQNCSEKVDSTQSKEPKENVLNNERSTQNHTLNKGNAGPPLTSKGLSNSDSGKKGVTVNTNSNKHKKKSVLTMSQQIESLKSKQPKANAETKEISAKQSEDDAVGVSSRTGNGGSTTRSPHRTEVSVPNHIHVDGETSAAKATEASSSGESDSVVASPRKVHSARKSASTSNVSRTQKSDMLKKQALLRSQSSQDSPASTASSSPKARMCSRETTGETTPVPRDSDTGSPSIASGGKDVSESTSNDTSEIEAFTPPRSGDILVLSDTMETSSQDNGHSEESKEQNRMPTQSPGESSTSGKLQAAPPIPDSKDDDMPSAEENSLPELTSRECEDKKSPEPEEADKEPASDEVAGTTKTPTSVASEEPERGPDVGKIKEKALLKLKENLKKNLLKGKISPQTSSASSRLESRSSSNESPETPMDTTEGTSLTDETCISKKELQASIATPTLSDNLEAKNHVSSGIQDSVPEVNGEKVLEENIGEPSEPSTGDNNVAESIAVDIADDNIRDSQSDKPPCSAGEMQTSQDSNEPVAEGADHICNDLLENSSATKESTFVNSPNADAEAVKLDCALPDDSDEASRKDDPSMPEVGDSLGSPVEDLSDGSVDLGPHEPGDMDSIDDDLLLEDEPIIISEDYNPEPEKMDSSPVTESLDSEVSELSIARVESHSEDVLQQVDSNQPSTSKRTLASDVEDVVDEPVCKKSRTETADVIADEGPEPVEAADVTEADSKEVIFTQNEWKEFALSIKEKYEKLVQTFNQKTNVMYEAQAQWQQETLTWKKNYQELEKKYERLAVQVKEGAAVEKQSVEVQTTFTHRTKLSRKKKEATRSLTPENKAPQEEAMETEQGETSSSGAPVSSGTPPPPTSDCEPSAASSSRPNSAPIPESTPPASNKSSNLEAKRQVFKATLNKVMLSKKNLSGGIEGASSSDVPSGKTVVHPNGATADTGAAVQEYIETTVKGDSNEDSPAPMDISEPGSKTADTRSTQSPTTLAASMSTKGPNLAITASGTTTAASQQRETSTSNSTPSTSETSNLPSQTIPSPSKSPTGTAGNAPTASQSKAQSEPSEKTKVPSATDSSKLPGSLKHSPGTASKEASKDSAEKSSSETDKESLVSKTVKPAQAQADPEVIDLTDDPDPPPVSISKSSAPSLHKPQDAPHGNKHSTLTTRSPHSLSPAAPSVSAVVSGASSASASGARQVQTVAPSLVLQNASQRSVQRTGAVQPDANSRTGSKTGPVQSPKRNSPGVPQSASPQANRQSSASIQLRNVNPPVVTTQMQGSNIRSQVVSLQHGPRQQILPAGSVSQGLVVQQQQPQQRQMPSSQQATTTTVSGLQPVMATMQNQARVQGQAAMQQRLQQQQQQISLKMLQQGRQGVQGVHQLPGAAASAAALATRQPQTWIQQPRQQLQVTSTQQQSLQVCQQIQLPTGQIQVQMVRPHGATALKTLTTSTGQQLVLQRPQQQQTHFQVLARNQASTQEQIQAQERAHAANQAQARAKAAREQREQEHHQQARIAAERLQSSQLDQQQAQRAQIKKLQEDRGVMQTKIQQHQNKRRLLLNQIQREDEMQRTLVHKLSLKQSGMSHQVYKSGQKQIQELKEQERKLRGELSLVDKSIEECIQKSSQIDQRLRQATAAATMRLSPQEIQKQQLQQQQQQLNAQLVQRQFQQQRTQQLQQQQQQQQQQAQLQQQKQRTESAKTKHPAQLPDLNSVLDVPRQTLFTPMPIKPSLEIKHSQEGIVLSWKADPDAGASKIDVKRYLLYAYQESESATPSTDLWKKIGAVDALPLPMACTLTHFKAGSMYHFAVCAISKHGRPGAFSNIGSINLP